MRSMGEYIGLIKALYMVFVVYRDHILLSASILKHTTQRTDCDRRCWPFGYFKEQTRTAEYIGGLSDDDIW